MTVVQSSNRVRAIFLAFILTLALGTPRLVHAADARSADNAYLDAL